MRLQTRLPHPGPANLRVPKGESTRRIVATVVIQGAPVLDIDPFSAQSLADPYPVHDLMRDSGPVFQLARYGVWGVARHAEVRSVLSDWRSYCSSAGVGLTNTRKEK